MQRLLKIELCRVAVRPLYDGPQAQDARKDVRVALLSERELLPHCADPALELPEMQARAAFARGDLCVGAMHGGKLVGYQWLGFGPTPHVDGVWVRLDRRARYSYKKFVLPQYRGQRIAGMMSRRADVLCLLRGRDCSVSFIDIHNRASWRSSARLGSRTVGYAGYLWLGPRLVAFHSPGARRYGFAFYQPGSGAVGSAFALGVAGKKSLDRSGG